MNKKKVITITVIVGIIITGILCYVTNKEVDREINKNDLSTNEQIYLQQFYIDSSIVSKGKLFDVRYTIKKTKPYNPASSSFEIVKKYDIDMSELKGKVIFTNGKEFKLDIGLQNSAMSAKSYMFGKESVIYHCNLYEVAIDLNDATPFSSLYQIEDFSTYDFTTIKLEFEYKGERETHILNYDEEKMVEAYKRFFQSYYEGELELNEDTVHAFTVLYQDYISILQQKGLAEVRTFIDEFVSYYRSEEYYSETYLGIRNLIYDYFSPNDSITEENSKEVIKELKEFLQENAEYIDRLDNQKKELELTLSCIVNILEVCGEKDTTINIEISEEEYYEAKSDVHKFWEFVNKYLK